LPDAEHVARHASNGLAHHLAAVPRPTHDVLDRVPGLLERQDLPRGVFATQETPSGTSGRRPEGHWTTPGQQLRRNHHLDHATRRLSRGADTAMPRCRLLARSGSKATTRRRLRSRTV
jgi:hypothetical protein